MASKAFAVHNWPGPIASMAPSKIDFNLWPETRLRIKMAPAVEALISTDTAPSYTVDDIVFEVDTLDMPAEYYSALEQRLQGGGMLEVPYQQWYAFSGASQVVNNAKLNFQLSSQSIDGLIATYKAVSNYQDPTYGAGRASQHFDFGSSDFTGCGFRLNSTQVPDYGTMGIPQSFVSAIDMLSGLQDTVSSVMPALADLTAYKSNHLAVCLRTNFGDDSGMGSRLISGISSTGAAVNVQVEYKGGSTTCYPMCLVATTASILIGANRQVTVRQ
jgi:hypothetical protein